MVFLHPDLDQKIDSQESGAHSAEATSKLLRAAGFERKAEL